MTRKEMEEEFIALAQIQAQRLNPYPGILVQFVEPLEDGKAAPEKKCSCKASRGQVVFCYCRCRKRKGN